MKIFSAQYVITNTGLPLKRGLITTEDDGTIISIRDTEGNLEEKHSIEYHNGIIIPGFVNCHCHLELSHLKGRIAKGGGLAGFLEQIRNERETEIIRITSSADSADNEMYKEGIVLCADICNTSLSFGIKKKSQIKYLNLLEVFGIEQEKAGRRMDELERVAETAKEMSLPFFLVPHSVYSMSLTLLRILKAESYANKVTTIHFMETEGEKEFLENHSGPIMASYKSSGLVPKRFETVESHAAAVLNEITPAGNLILVHNTFADRKIIRKIQRRENLYWCLCPNANIYIENKMPPLDLIREERCNIVMGTDSLASNNRLSILDELKTLQMNFPEVLIPEMVRWATLNGAQALDEADNFGKLEPGKKPGLLLLQDVDLVNMNLLPGSYVTRLI